MPVAASFFSTQPKTELLNFNAAQAVAESDRFFKAAVVAMIDNILVKPSANEKLAKKLLALLERSSVKQIEHLMEAPIARVNYIKKLAALLQPLVEQEIRSNAKKYSILFKNKTALSKIALANTPNQYQALIEALAKVLKLPVKLQEVEQGKTLAKSSTSKQIADSIGSPLVLQLQANSIAPFVTKPAYFELLASQGFAAVTENRPTRADSDEVYAEVAEHDLMLYKEYTETVKRLKTMLDAKDITFEDLKAIYIKNIHHLHATDYAGVQHGTQRFFAEIEKMYAPDKMITPSQDNYATQVANSLINAIARGITLKQLDESLVYEAEEKTAFSSRK